MTMVFIGAVNVLVDITERHRAEGHPGRRTASNAVKDIIPVFTELGRR
jgi:hypothetical protein